MKTALQLLLDSPDEQIMRMRLVVRAITHGQWDDAAHHLRNAASDTEKFNCVFAGNCRELAAHCQITADLLKK